MVNTESWMIDQSLNHFDVKHYQLEQPARRLDASYLLQSLLQQLVGCLPPLVTPDVVPQNIGVCFHLLCRLQDPVHQVKGVVVLHSEFIERDLQMFDEPVEDSVGRSDDDRVSLQQVKSPLAIWNK